MRQARVFGSHEEFFGAVRDLIADLKRSGHSSAATELAQGFRCLNGLTDGWALLLESIQKIQSTLSADLDTNRKAALPDLRAAAQAAVHRR